MFYQDEAHTSLADVLWAQLWHMECVLVLSSSVSVCIVLGMCTEFSLRYALALAIDEHSSKRSV